METLVSTGRGTAMPPESICTGNVTHDSAWTYVVLNLLDYNIRKIATLRGFLDDELNFSEFFFSSFFCSVRVIGK